MVVSQYYLVESFYFDGDANLFRRVWETVTRSPVKPIDQEELRLWLAQCAVHIKLRETAHD